MTNALYFEIDRLKRELAETQQIAIQRGQELIERNVELTEERAKVQRILLSDPESDKAIAINAIAKNRILSEKLKVTELQLAEEREKAQQAVAIAEVTADGSKVFLRTIGDFVIEPGAKFYAAPIQQPEGMQHVDFYEREFYPLSNFSAFTLTWRGLSFPTSEHAYQWEKFKDSSPSTADIIRTALSAHEAFKCAESLRERRRVDWDDVKINTMRAILRAKAGQHEYVRRKLLETGTRELIECSWRDDFWGWGPNRDGKNMLGKLWMEIREELAAARGGKEGT